MKEILGRIIFRNIWYIKGDIDHNNIIKIVDLGYTVVVVNAVINSLLTL